MANGFFQATQNHASRATTHPSTTQGMLIHAITNHHFGGEGKEEGAASPGAPKRYVTACATSPKCKAAMPTARPSTPLKAGVHRQERPHRGGARHFSACRPAFHTGRSGAAGYFLRHTRRQLCLVSKQKQHWHRPAWWSTASRCTAFRTPLMKAPINRPVCTLRCTARCTLPAMPCKRLPRQLATSFVLRLVF